MFVGRLNTHQQLEQSQTKRVKRARFAYERARKRFLSRFGVYLFLALCLFLCARSWTKRTGSQKEVHKI